MAEQAGLPDTTITPDGMLTQPTVTWDSPGAPNISRPATPGIRGPIKTDLSREYVAARPNEWYLNLVRVLPFAIDDITQDFGADLYERMMFDSMVNAAVSTIKAAILEDGLNMRPAVIDAEDPEYDDAVRYLSEVERMLDDADFDLDSWLWNQLDALYLGNKISEIVYNIERAPMANGASRLQFTLGALHTKPRRSVGFAVDIYSNVIGIMSLIPGVGMPVYTGNVVVKPENQPNLLPREKFAILSHRPKDEDPRGTTLVRPAYTPWNLKMQLWADYAKWLKQFASPILLGYTPEESMQTGLVDPIGQPLLDQQGNQLMPVTPEQAMLNTLVALASGSVAVFPGGSKVTPIEMRGQGAPFLNAFKMLNEEIATAIHGQSMTASPPKYGTKALGTIQENTLETIIHQEKAFVLRMWRKDVLRRWIRYNYGKAKEHLAPKCSLGQTEQQDLATELGALAAAGYSLDPSQFIAIDDRLGLPVRAIDWQARTELAIAQQTYLQQEGYAAGSAAGQAGAAGSGVNTSGGAGGSSSASQTNGGGQQAQRAAMAAKLRQRTGIRLDPSAAPPPPNDAEEAWLKSVA